MLAVSIVFSACKKEEEDTIAAPTVLSGCTDAIATNYDATATSDDGSCTFGIVGGTWITDSTVMNAHVIVSFNGMIVMDTNMTEVENNPDSLDSYKVKFWENGDFKEWDINSNIVDSGTWVQLGNNVTITSDTIRHYELLNITKTNAINEFTGNETWNENGADYNIDYVANLYATRDPNGFTSNNTNQRKGNTSWINKRKLINSIKR